MLPETRDREGTENSDANDVFAKQIQAFDTVFTEIFSELTSQCELQGCLSFLKKYGAIVEAAELWNFVDCSYIYSEDDAEVKEDIKIITLVQSLAENIRILKSVAKHLAFDKTKRDLADRIDQDYVSATPEIRDLKQTLATMLICNVLVKPVTQERLTMLSKTMKLVEKLGLTSKTLLGTVQKK